MSRLYIEPSDLIVERAENGAFRLIWLERDEETGARSVLNIMEAPADQIHYVANSHGEIPADKIRANWTYDIGKATKTSSVVRKIVEQWSEPTESLTVEEPPEIVTVALPVVDGVILVQPTLTPLQAKKRLESEKSFTHEGWKYEWDDDAKSPFAFAKICIGDPREGHATNWEFYANGESGDPIDESSYWIAV